MNVDLFYDTDFVRGARKRAHTARAKTICATCPDLKQCLAQALRVGEPEGVWGGLTAKERDTLYDPTAIPAA